MILAQHQFLMPIGSFFLYSDLLNVACWSVTDCTNHQQSAECTEHNSVLYGKPAAFVFVILVPMLVVGAYVLAEQCDTVVAMMFQA